MKIKKVCSKVYSDLPFAHRQPVHDGHCAYIHGHNWSFKFTFAAKELDECGFVMDFGKLKWLKSKIYEEFDHTLVLNDNDPQLPFLREALERNGLAKITVVPDCSSEGLAAMLLDVVNKKVQAETDGRVKVESVEVIEDARNSATVSNHE